jgi:type IV pilus assembly protein PilC
MPEFQYLAIRAGEHKITKGVADRPSLQAFENDAIDRRLAVLKVERKREKEEEKVSRTKIPLKAKINFFQQMATCYKLQIHLAKAFDIIQDACAHKVFKVILGEVKEEIESGGKISASIAKYPRIFDPITLALVAVGEEAGVMEKVCRQIKTLLARNQQVQKKLRSIMIYPATVCTVLTLSLYIMTTQVIPKFAVIFASVQMSLPLPTQILMSISRVASGHPLLTLGLAGAFLYLVVQFPRIFRHVHQLHRLSLRLPVIGVIQRQVIMANFARTFSNLIDANVTLIRSLSLVRDVSPNFCYRAMIARAILAVNEGRKMSPLMTDTDVFKKDFVRLLQFADETAQTSAILAPLADELDNELNVLIDDLKPVIESLIIVIIGIILGGVLLALFLPIFNISEAIKAEAGG